MEATLPRHSKRVVAVIAAFQPTLDLVVHCARLAPQVSRVLVVDDGSDSSADACLRALSANNIEVHRLEDNLGIGAAINYGIQLAREFSPEFVVTFDQDSSIPEGFIEALVDTFDKVRKTGVQVGMVAPEYYSQTPQSDSSSTEAFIEAIAPIQSGLLMPLAVIDALGPQKASFFIDLIDTEYFFRAKLQGYIAICAPGLTLPHGFGNKVFLHAFGKPLLKPDGSPRIASVSSPFRYYYRARNRIFLNSEFRTHWPTLRILISQTVNDLVLDFAVAIFSARGRWCLFMIMCAGWRDGLIGKAGKMPHKTLVRASKITWRNPVDQGQVSDAK